jgi:3-hydroxyacyl-CoA dehydrogenase
MKHVDVLVVGAGVMGVGIAQVAAQARRAARQASS